MLYHLVIATVALSLAACSGGEAGEEGIENDPNVIYHDDFSPESAGSWLLEGDEYGLTAIRDGRLLIDVNQANSLQFTTLEEPSLTDFDLTVDTELIEGNRDTTYGVLFRLSGPEEFYRFELTGDGRYVVERHDADGSWRRLVDGWQKSEVILAGPGAANRLRIVATGPSMAFYANDELLAETQDGTYLAGKMALDAGTFSNQRAIIGFDNLTVRNP